jgi:V8-like Glu-specific endopeptidase
MQFKNKILLSIILAGSLSVTKARDIEKVVYGEDNRVDVYESSNPLFKAFASSTAAMISNSSLKSSGDMVTINGGTLKGDGICSDERFANQMTAASCSGFLVAPDLLVTAGHCVQSMADCESYSWVFDYSNIAKETTAWSIDKKNVFSCVEIISRTLNDGTDNDFALVRLDRAADRTPLKFRKEGRIDNKSGLVVIGHPSGLPTKIADGAFIRRNKNKYYFQTNLDTFGGNSGSAVINTKSGEVEGILVRGERDYVLDTIQNCYRSKICKMDECRGEDVTRITNIGALKKL